MKKNLFHSPRTIFLISLFFYMMPTGCMEQQILDPKIQLRDVELGNASPEVNEQEAVIRIAEPNQQQERNNRAAPICSDDGRIGRHCYKIQIYLAIACGLATGGILTAKIIKDSLSTSFNPVTTCSSDSIAIQNALDLSNQCWFYAAHNSLTGDTLSSAMHCPINETTSTTIQRINDNLAPLFSTNSTICVTTQDCSSSSCMPLTKQTSNKPLQLKIKNKQSHSLSHTKSDDTAHLKLLLYGASSQRAQTKQNNNKTPKYLFKK